eukprot:CAMPEP_0194410842 /NCGR_PEP_ID=MMETSP0176-20130528/8965_1 /TAXON_ID=216777 /ORGANISM="Proboscia alata, Strain PI-D3" /LENGTH=59 /DNA_ID=CAMNT_0039212439 /DNA_START=39 /DNA_END=214 /DNA_ORIENTATION=+
MGWECSRRDGEIHHSVVARSCSFLFVRWAGGFVGRIHVIVGGLGLGLNGQRMMKANVLL